MIASYLEMHLVLLKIIFPGNSCQRMFSMVKQSDNRVKNPPVTKNYYKSEISSSKIFFGFKVDLRKII